MVGSVRSEREKGEREEKEREKERYTDRDRTRERERERERTKHSVASEVAMVFQKKMSRNCEDLEPHFEVSMFI